MTTRSRYMAAVNDKPWWLAGGIPLNACTLVLQPQGANSADASLNNLARPLSERITSDVYTSWSCTGGWYNDGTKGMLSLNEIAALSGEHTDNVTWMCKIKDPVTDDLLHTPFFLRYGGYYLYMRIKATTGFIMGNGGTEFTSESTAGSGIYTAAGNECYLNTTYIGSNQTALLGTSSNRDSVNAGYYTNPFPFYGYLQALCIYKIKLSYYQICMVNQAMNAL